jgi:hypothetical protein
MRATREFGNRESLWSTRMESRRYRLRKIEPSRADGKGRIVADRSESGGYCQRKKPSQLFGLDVKLARQDRLLTTFLDWSLTSK